MNTMYERKLSERTKELREAQRLLSLYRELVNRANIHCESLHHKVNERHVGSAPCPVEEKFKEIL